jgi:hypothetical protein
MDGLERTATNLCVLMDATMGDVWPQIFVDVIWATKDLHATTVSYIQDVCMEHVRKPLIVIVMMVGRD